MQYDREGFERLINLSLQLYKVRLLKIVASVYIFHLFQIMYKAKKNIKIIHNRYLLLSLL